MVRSETQFHAAWDFRFLCPRLSSPEPNTYGFITFCYDYSFRNIFVSELWEKIIRRVVKEASRSALTLASLNRTWRQEIISFIERRCIKKLGWPEQGPPELFTTSLSQRGLGSAAAYLRLFFRLQSDQPNWDTIKSLLSEFGGSLQITHKFLVRTLESESGIRFGTPQASILLNQIMSPFLPAPKGISQNTRVRLIYAISYIQPYFRRMRFSVRSIGSVWARPPSLKSLLISPPLLNSHNAKPLSSPSP